MAGQCSASEDEAKVITETGPKDIFELLKGPHEHCATCFSFTRCTQEGDACDFKECSCGAVFHECKLDQHLECCLHQQVPCLNADYGCDLILARGKRSCHLLKCPANVIMCKAEWNRWPLYTIERRRHIPFRQMNPRAKEGQLDYDLALRDQRMLDSLNQLPRRTKLCLRNYLTRRFPAVPIPPSVLKRAKEEKENSEKNGKHDLSDDDQSDYIDIGDGLSYIGAKKKGGLDEQMQRWQDDLDNRLKGKKIPPKYWEFPELEKGNVHKHCAYCFDGDCKKSNDFFTSYDDIACHIIDCRQDCGARYHNCKSSEHMIICPNYDQPDEYEWMFRGMSSGRDRIEAKKKKQLKKEVDQLFMFLERSWPEQKSDSANRELTTKKPNVIPTAPPMPSNLHVLCPLDIRLDTVTRLQTKPRSMYTFVCAQEFKRKDYGWHYKNIHSEIHGGLNNWIEHRCPLAGYGCGYSSRRMSPHNSDNTLVYSSAVESFGITSSIQSKTSPQKLATNKLEGPAKKKSVSNSPAKKKSGGSGKMVLTDLPFEMLETIFRLLDSFSLCNLAVTCVYFREICCGLLDSHGCVDLQWERVKLPAGKHHWKVAYKRWFFSPSIDPIEKWSFTSDEGAVSEHLKVCPYNARVVHNPIPKDHPIWTEVLKGLQVKINEKRQSEWFIK